MSEELLIRYCAPTLAGIKTGSLFSCTFSDQIELRDSLRRWNRMFTKKGLRILCLRVRNGRALIYIYRPAQLSRDLEDQMAEQLLQERGYLVQSPDRCVVQLVKRLSESEEFPHEIGLFLGYPPEDVCGFIENEAANCKCVGCWKVYGDAAAAQRRFAQYKKCTDLYCSLLAQGRSVERLTVAG